MQRAALLLLLILLAFSPTPGLRAQGTFQQDTLPTGSGDLTITFIGHGTLMFSHGETVVHVDPVSREADYTHLPDADLILVTHEHGDHLDPEAIALLQKDDTRVVASPSCEGRIEGVRIMENGEEADLSGFHVEAVPAYNRVHMRSEGTPYHPQGNGNGYIITFEDLRVYVAGDTENIPEMKALQDIDVAFLPMNLPYTMTPEMVADAARAFRPRILYPYHFGDTDPSRLVDLLGNEPEIEVRVREMG